MRKISKKGAIELSIGTVVIIVIAMTALILSLVLVRRIFTGGTESITILNEKVKSEITNLFSEENSKIAVRVGSDRLVTVKQGSSVGIAIGARAETSRGTQGRGGVEDNLKFTLTLLPTHDTNCVLDVFSKYFKYLDFPPGTNYETSPQTFDEISDLSGFSIIVIEVPKNARANCEYRVKISLLDYTTGQNPPPQYTTFFRVKILPRGIFN